MAGAGLGGLGSFGPLTGPGGVCLHPQSRPIRTPAPFCWLPAGPEEPGHTGAPRPIGETAEDRTRVTQGCGEGE